MLRELWTEGWRRRVEARVKLRRARMPDLKGVELGVQ
jgi:hypothetical protein